MTRTGFGFGLEFMAVEGDPMEFGAEHRNYLDLKPSLIQSWPDVLNLSAISALL